MRSSNTLTMNPVFEELFRKLHVLWDKSGLKEAEEFEETDLGKLTLELGRQHRCNSRAEYEENALKILDFAVYRIPLIVVGIIQQYGVDSFSVAAAGNAVNSRFQANISNAFLYLCADSCVPYIYNSGKLFRKMQLMEWMLKEVLNVVIRDSHQFDPVTVMLLKKGLVGHADQSRLSIWSNPLSYAVSSSLNVLVPARKRLPATQERLVAYAKENQLQGEVFLSSKDVEAMFASLSTGSAAVVDQVVGAAAVCQ